jgi:hypothetical protein
MNTKLYVVHDLVAQESGPVFEAKNDEVAMRKFRKMITDQNNVIQPSDYQLLSLGEMDHETNIVEGCSVPDLVMQGYDAMTFGEMEEEVE